MFKLNDGCGILKTKSFGILKYVDMIRFDCWQRNAHFVLVITNLTSMYVVTCK